MNNQRFAIIFAVAIAFVGQSYSRGIRPDNGRRREMPDRYSNVRLRPTDMDELPKHSCIVVYSGDTVAELERKLLCLPANLEVAMFEMSSPVRLDSSEVDVSNRADNRGAKLRSLTPDDEIDERPDDADDGTVPYFEEQNQPKTADGDHAMPEPMDAATDADGHTDRSQRRNSSRMQSTRINTRIAENPQTQTDMQSNIVDVRPQTKTTVMRSDPVAVDMRRRMEQQ